MRNEMMRRPVVKPEIVDFMRTQQKQLPGLLGDIEKQANENNVPIIPHETVIFMQFLLGQVQPKNVLEIGTAIGFSASLMRSCLPADSCITTIDRYDKMIAAAKENFAKQGIADSITLLEGQAADILPTLTGPYDFIFMDSAKSKYIEFLPECLRLLAKGGILMIDDIFQGGTVLADSQTIPRGQRAIHRKLNELFDTVLPHPQLTSTVIPLGDGVLLITKDAETVEFN